MYVWIRKILKALAYTLFSGIILLFIGYWLNQYGWLAEPKAKMSVFLLKLTNSTLSNPLLFLTIGISILLALAWIAAYLKMSSKSKNMPENLTSEKTTQREEETPSTPTSMSRNNYNFYGNVGSMQAGAGAVANVHMEIKSAGGDQGRKTDYEQLPLRISMSRFFMEAEERGWIIRLNTSAGILDLCKGLKQAGVDGQIDIYGREYRTGKFSSIPLVVIEPKFWIKGIISWTSCFEDLNSQPFRYVTENTDTVTEHLASNMAFIHEYYDIHLHRQQAITWLEIEADGYK